MTSLLISSHRLPCILKQVWQMTRAQFMLL